MVRSSFFRSYIWVCIIIGYTTTHASITSKEQALQYNTSAAKYMLSSQYIPASMMLIKAIAIGEKHHYDDILYESYTMMGKIFFHQNNFKKARYYYTKSYLLNKKDTLYAANYHKYLGDIFLVEGNIDSAKNAYGYAETLYKTIQDLDSNLLGKFYSNYSITFENNFIKKLEYALAADSYYTELSTSNIINKGNIGTSYKDIVIQYIYDSLSRISDIIPATKAENIALAKSYLTAAIRLAVRTNDKADQAYFSGVLSELQYEEGDYKGAYLNYRLYYETTDSIFSQESKNALAEVESKLEIQQKNAVIVQQKRTRIALISGLLLLGIIGLLLYMQAANRKRSNDKLQQLNVQLDATNQIKTKFFSIISHDLRSPIANIVTLLNFQKDHADTLPEGALEKHREKVIHDAENLLESMETMLLWSKGQMQNFKPSFKTIAINDLFGYLQRFFSNVENVEMIFISNDIEYLTTDENFMQVIMQNLTANAIKAMRHTTNATLSWEAYREGDSIILQIQDNGPGIAAENLETILHPTATSSDKHGLGLQIVGDLARAIKCKITFISTENKGLITQIIV